MRLEDVSAEIRPRTEWEAVDLGLAMVRHHLGSLLAIWGLCVIPVWLVLGLSLAIVPAWVVLLIVWWLRPIYSRPVLYYLSHSLFGAEPSLWETFRQWPRLAVRHLFYSLVAARFSPWRTFLLPVLQLEGLKGGAFAARRRGLSVQGGDICILMTVIRICMEAFFFLGFWMTMMAFLPATLHPDWQVLLDDFRTAESFSSVFVVLSVLAFLATVALGEILHTGIGFALYLNSRTKLEGWDIELVFRRLGQRLKNATGMIAGVIVFVFLIVGTGVSDLRAEEEDPAVLIKEIKKHEDFKVHTRTVRVPVGRDFEGWDFGDGFAEMVASLAKVVFWVIVALLLALLVWFIAKNAGLFRLWKGDDRKKAAPVQAKTVMGMTVTPESLPEDVVAAARRAWEKGLHQESLGLLYRGAISWLVGEGGVPIRESDTESNCLRRAGNLEDRERFGYFRGLTGVWMQMAYGKVVPSDDVVRKLCQDWPFQAGRLPKGGKGMAA